MVNWSVGAVRVAVTAHSKENGRRNLSRAKLLSPQLPSLAAHATLCIPCWISETRSHYRMVVIENWHLLKNNVRLEVELCTANCALGAWRTVEYRSWHLFLWQNDPACNEIYFSFHLATVFVVNNYTQRMYLKTTTTTKNTFKHHSLTAASWKVLFVLFRAFHP